MSGPHGTAQFPMQRRVVCIRVEVNAQYYKEAALRYVAQRLIELGVKATKREFPLVKGLKIQSIELEEVADG